MSERDGTDTRPVGERAGLNGNPLAPSVRDAPRRAPRSTVTLLLETAPFLLLAGVVVLVVAGR
ncbi:hypothetical protein [Cellulomonas pakistanensis]|uniref:Uncharacterized protein n=1 Tax=Cellulomonas pakistanensis TaxID=992287 RepID=A0A919U5F6_9CELL|nr:hypothetical protein [Cellulomonas pakistanensis]GIG34962.1 hypothetical protein Cpa01nite_03430 [Cellulomonas pakistanensis]